jgi:ABC-type polysaccharide/polyol phosphate transport system ATPase subunit
VNVVEFESVSKIYPIYDSPRNRLLELATFGTRTFHQNFVALNRVSFEVARGEVFCIVGANGSGKSTLLKIVAGIHAPSSGNARIAGTVAALLELGAGFNPEFSGRENVYLNGAVHGLSTRQIDQRFAEIEAFAEIGEFIHQPVKTYSSGMTIRLAFAVAISVEPEILIVDEALAVGDTYFRHKCMRRVHELRSRGTSILFVSHSSADVKAIGDRALWLDRGHAMAVGPVDEVLGKYLAAMDPASNGTNSAALPPTNQSSQIDPVLTIPNVDHRHGDGRAQILGIALLSEFGDPLHLMAADHRTLVRISLRAHSTLEKPDVGFVMRNHLGIEFAGASTTSEHHPLSRVKSGETVTVDFLLEIPELYPGAFSFSPFVKDGSRADSQIIDWIDNAITIQMAHGDGGPVYGYIQLPCRIEVNPQPHSHASLTAGTGLHLV